jgi:hypothetical protein
MSVISRFALLSSRNTKHYLISCDFFQTTPAGYKHNFLLQLLNSQEFCGFIRHILKCLQESGIECSKSALEAYINPYPANVEKRVSL